MLKLIMLVLAGITFLFGFLTLWMPSKSEEQGVRFVVLSVSSFLMAILFVLVAILFKI